MEGSNHDVAPQGEEMGLVTVETEPSQAELAQCQAEVGTLLSIIAELNRKMGALQAPGDPEDIKPVRSVVPQAPEYLTSPSSHYTPAKRGWHSLSCIKPPFKILCPQSF